MDTRQEELDRDLLIEVDVGRRNDDAYASLTEHPIDAVLPREDLPNLDGCRRDCHRSTSYRVARLAVAQSGRTDQSVSLVGSRGIVEACPRLAEASRALFLDDDVRAAHQNGALLARDRECRFRIEQRAGVLGHAGRLSHEMQLVWVVVAATEEPLPVAR